MSEIVEPSSTSPLVSVIVPTYNRAEFISDAIESILTQTYSNIELIVVDDGSTDNTDEVVRKYETIKYVKTDNRGVSSARNKGISLARGAYIAFLDSDDTWAPRKLELQLDHYHKNPDAGIITGSTGYIDRSGEKLDRVDICPEIITNLELEIFSGLPGGPCNVLIKKSVLNDVGGFDTTLLRSEDRDLWMRISRKYPVYGIEHITCYVRLHGTPRHKINLDTIKNNRIEVNRRIRDKKVKRKADAWMYYCFFKLHHNNRETLPAIWYLFLTWTTYPWNIHARCKRLRHSAEMILPGPIYRMLRLLKPLTSR